MSSIANVLTPSVLLMLIPAKIPTQIIPQQAQGDSAASEPTPIPKPPPTILDILQINLPDHRGQADKAASDTTKIEDRPSTRRGPRRSQQSNLYRRQRRKKQLCIVLVCKSDGFNASLDVIADIHAGVNEVVNHGPNHTTRIEEAGSHQSM